jgi:hypothetical protein
MGPGARGLADLAPDAAHPLFVTQTSGAGASGVPPRLAPSHRRDRNRVNPLTPPFHDPA